MAKLSGMPKKQLEYTRARSLLTFDQHHHTSRLLQLAHHLLQRVRAHDLRALRLVVQKVVHLLRGAIVGADHEAMVVHVQDQVLTHHGQTDQSDIGTAVVRFRGGQIL